jgi:hypothetical protein
MPAHRAAAAQPASPPVPVAGILLGLVMIVTVCLLSIAAADSSIEPGDGGAAVTAR